MIPEWKQLGSDIYMFREKLYHDISKDYGDSLDEVKRWRYGRIMYAITFYQVENEITQRSTR